jgi:hypothetical protein
MRRRPTSKEMLRRFILRTLRPKKTDAQKDAIFRENYFNARPPKESSKRMKLTIGGSAAFFKKKPELPEPKIQDQFNVRFKPKLRVGRGLIFNNEFADLA